MGEWHDRVMALQPWYQHFVFPDGTDVGTWETNAKCDALCSGIPLRGKTVLDVACMAGAASLWLDGQGAVVSSCDNYSHCEAQFALVKEAFGMWGQFTLADVYDLPTVYQWRFDAVLMMGLYYHLQHPLLGLQKAWEVTREVLLIEGEVSDKAGCSADFYEHEYLGDATNWWVPTVDCLLAWCYMLDEVRLVEPIWPLVAPSRMGIRVWRKREGE